jgi:adenylate cyclase
MMRVFRGWSLSEEGSVEEGIQDMRAGFKDYRTMGGGVLGTSCLVHLCEGLLRAGRHEEGLDVVAEAVQFVSSSDEHHYEPEIYRVKGELLRAQAEKRRGDGGLPEAEASLQRGIEISRSQGARSFELRGATALARLWQKHGNRHEAARVLQQVYGAFTEGFATPDLRQARALLDELVN